MKIVLGWWDSQTDFFLLSCERVKRRKAQNNCCGMSEGCRTSDLDLTKVTLQWLSVTLVDFWTSQIWNFIDALNLYENIWRAGYQYSVYQFLLAATQKHYPSRQKKKERKCASSSHLLHPFETKWCLLMMLFIEATMWFVDLIRIFLSHNCSPLFSCKIQKHHISWDIWPGSTNPHTFKTLHITREDCLWLMDYFFIDNLFLWSLLFFLWWKEWCKKHPMDKLFPKLCFTTMNGHQIITGVTGPISSEVIYPKQFTKLDVFLEAYKGIRATLSFDFSFTAWLTALSWWINR